MLYSDMTPEQLQREMKELQQKGQRAYDAENWSEYEVLMKKWYLAKSYLVQQDIRIAIGETYRLAEEYDRLTVSKVKGIMAWGTRMSDGAEIAVPIAMLEKDAE
ncbi:DUF1811 family protein [Alicyclobacillus shizuokensis]|uniref:DUF1811 family protein n=1 Tax=Alicyclobacillus shizuokensis TaxID=392014 RepID=UPI00082E3BE0|nr:DUF1811 family protein [Alicyclobacillus shizuokensis]MCL6627562.1 YfhH family protein [Alicyclobacillus shizuokensis]